MLLSFKAYFMTNPLDNNHLLNKLNICTTCETLLVLEMQVINTKWSLLSEVISHLGEKNPHVQKKKKERKKNKKIIHICNRDIKI